MEATHYNWSDFQQCRCVFSAHVVQQLFNTVPKKLDIWPEMFLWTVFNRIPVVEVWSFHKGISCVFIVIITDDSNQRQCRSANLYSFM